MKTEPDAFSIDDLQQSPNQTTTWDGVRNYRARKYLRDEMRIGDAVLFYHSNAKPPGVAGLAEITREGYPDHTALDPTQKYHDPKATQEKNPWYMVDVTFREKFTRFVSLHELKETPGLEQMKVIQRGMRLSVQRVLKNEFEIVVALGRELESSS